MTRINLINPSELSDQHLIAEYREIFMIGSALQRSIKSKTWEKTKKNLPKEFTLNIGHVKFFYNKGKYLHKRYIKLIDEMKCRGMNPNPERQFKKEQWPNDFYKDWGPSAQDIKLIRKRIKEKINQKPNWYRWTKKKATKQAQNIKFL
ncbi:MULTISPECIES: pyrimidine dimer DNA glycosylase/endonuclease V [Prochlorococcus]|uniref:Pyrimidine dimer DNA glycosylase/Endonuclease V n=1 Tax=Prochlorococcus marinus (strain SARG / CCMP1375 / SS120) TaxID=167539 RepID=Q7TV95_PROMA|nr:MULTISPECIES: pyrimidine dimer DNA glycosylase/endonuclease V [Prochlorococcus]AAQ00533.1 Pyrimidine dimer DNA glycosylase/Endonuclease V [Prochlorococcus marinus subsp. marinus str. CCMP1375]KGG10296.1 Pyrimidine dimer DNA glycosylase [Prochlorococcus marinus str. LG]KGG22617.1 Pyrimidine dimer DNA glycosylase [Prochlorococcus marinus str. SS2]KGG24230.1 Pyrimidine dimer DNA glycosylase [Prochlorococcus marinus str. SS35]KGG34577.1 Pyrimidine dimer DNA glycosylase [Prochlorococcus sp. SS52